MSRPAVLTSARNTRFTRLRIDLAKQGKGIIMISSEMPELIGMSNRILVMCNGHITGEVKDEEATQERIMSYATKF